MQCSPVVCGSFRPFKDPINPFKALKELNKEIFGGKIKFYIFSFPRFSPFLLVFTAPGPGRKLGEA